METLSKDQKLAKQQDALRQQQDEQRNGTQKMMKGNVDASYEFPVAEKDYYHLKVVTRNLDQAQKNFNDVTQVIKIHAGEFERRKKGGAFDTYHKTEILHNPKKGLPGEPPAGGKDDLTEEQIEAKAKEEAKARQAQAKAEAEAQEAKEKEEAAAAEAKAKEEAEKAAAEEAAKKAAEKKK